MIELLKELLNKAELECDIKARYITKADKAYRDLHAQLDAMTAQRDLYSERLGELERDLTLVCTSYCRYSPICCTGCPISQIREERENEHTSEVATGAE